MDEDDNYRLCPFDISASMCALCGHHFGKSSMESLCSKPTHWRFLTDHSDWTPEDRKTRFVSGHPDAIRDTYFELPWLWKRFSRAVLKTKDGEYVLTGVSLSWPKDTEGDPSIVWLPKSPDELIMGHPSIAQPWLVQATSRMIPHPNCPDLPRCYRFHERCWTLLTAILDTNLLTKHLDLLVEAMRKTYYWHSNWYGQPKLRDQPLDFFDDEHSWHSSKYDHGESYSRDPAAYTVAYTNSHGWSEEDYYFRDPWKIVELRDWLTEKKRVRDSQTSDKAPHVHGDKEFVPGDVQREYTGTLKAHSPWCKARCVCLPPELLMMILDQIPEDDVRDLMWTLPRCLRHWLALVPQSYWRTRFIKELILDENEVPELEELDWRDLYRNFEFFASRSHGMQNRVRIMRVLREIRFHFSGLLLLKEGTVI